MATNRPHFTSSYQKILIVCLSLFVFTTSLLFGAVYWRSAETLSVQADSILLWEARYFNAFSGNNLINKLNEQLANQRLKNYYALLDSAGKKLAGNINVQSSDVRIGLAHSLLLDGRAVRIQSFPQHDGRRLVIGRDITDVMQLRTTILVTLLWGDVCALIVFVACLLMLSFQQSKRLNRLSLVTEQIAHGALGLRLPTEQGDDVAMVSKLVNSMLTRIERLMTEVKNTSDHIAHDLRSPLSRARFALERALESDETQRTSLLEQAILDTDTTLGRFSAILRISEIESRKRVGNFASVDLCQTVKEVAEVLNPLFLERRIAVRMPEDRPVMVNGDRGLLFEAVFNVLENALKFSADSGEISVSILRRDATADLEIRDYGIGIPPAELHAIGRRFYRSSLSSGIPGAGLGLSLVSAIANLHHAQLVISNADPGTHVLVRFNGSFQ